MLHISYCHWKDHKSPDIINVEVESLITDVKKLKQYSSTEKVENEGRELINSPGMYWTIVLCSFDWKVSKSI